VILDPTSFFWIFAAFAAAISAMGFYCMLMTYNLLRVLIGLEILMKGVTLFVVASGYLVGQTAIGQGIIITVIIIEVVVMIVAAGIILGFQKEYDSLNVKNTRSMQG